ncbi:Bug family tripartite tricarboxylate transporter substrate binding protein [Roseomonas xinghualingensis]|uniref:Bug family tripartite tricarboxylate transporter substrate binding protein n=1 Tax=Roseomonas xinghualingensis TaxID=2986475 RepID=UPI0021F1470B|nr:tripartite tricarboxylate transporter substrate binding protein [Roseomonas sp. SXEYE001]MCV4207315.1 tripartite tricarboxylate transporter substrate binding protein [Roseomonas sp. SXEYE001]
MPFMPSGRRALLGAALAAPALSLARPVLGQGAAWPNRPIRMIVPFGAGTSTDIMTRLVTPRMSEVLGQPIVVENRPGAGGLVGSDAVAKLPPDGYNLCMGSIASHSVNQTLIRTIPYDVLRDFTPVSLVTNAPNLLVVGSQVPARTLPEFIAWAKTQRGVAYASAGNGTSSHLAGELLKLKTGAPLEHVPYRSAAQALTDVVSGQVPMTIYQVTAVLPFVRDGKLKALAATSARRLEWTPEVPTAIEQGLADFDVSAWHGLFAPASLPAPILDRIYGALNTALTDTTLRPRLIEQGLEPVGMKPAEFRTFLEGDIAKWREVIRAADIKAD